MRACRSLAAVMAAALALAACSTGDRGAEPPSTATPTSLPATTTATATPTSVPATAAATTPPQPTDVPTSAPTPSPSVAPSAEEPLGFPVDPGQPVGLVDYDDAGRPIRWGAGPGALAYSRDSQPGDDPRAAGAGGWNCRVHVAFEGRPAVDWYVPVGTAIRATMDGTATLYAITTTNAFDHYGVPRAPYVGDPAPGTSVSPFPGPGGGKGVFVEVRNEGFVTELAHLELALTLAVVPTGAYLPGFPGEDDLVERFAPLRGYLDATPLASWQVRRGDVVGYSGDSGYSEAPHLHYTIRRLDGGGLLCPTGEAGFEDGGWLFR